MFEVDKEGLARILEKRGKEFAIFEMVQNSWDENVTRVEVRLVPVERRPLAVLSVEDDSPDGFRDLSHAWTLFADSYKRSDPEKRGFMNLGEKLVIAVCDDAMISTTTGEVRFEAGKRQYFPRRGRVRGSIFTGTIRMTRSELAEASEKFRMLIPPPGVFTSFNGERLPLREPVASFETTLPTLISDEDGNLRRTARKTRVDIHEVRDGEEAHIYEMGIPVVPTSDKYHVDVQQKVPVTMDRTNVPPSYLRKIRAEVLNHTHDILTKKDASETWVTDAMGHGDITVGAVEKVMVQRFGRKRAIYDPSDQEANNRLAAKGYKIIHGGTFGKGVWEKIREAGAAKPSGAIAPTPKPFDPKGDPADVVPPEKWSEGMRYAEMLARELAECLLGESIHVDFINHPNPSWQAAYGSGHLSFFMKGTGRKFFDRWRVHDEDLKRLLGLLIHEFAHHHEKNHLSDGYAKAVERLGAQLSVLLMRSPNIVKKYLEA